MFSDVEDPFFLLFFLLVRNVCDVGWVPLLCVWKIEPKFLSRKKERGKGVCFSGVCEECADRKKDIYTPFYATFAILTLYLGAILLCDSCV